MGIERLPSGKFAVNSVILHIAMIAFNALRFIGQTALTFKEDLPYETKMAGTQEIFDQISSGKRSILTI